MHARMYRLSCLLLMVLSFLGTISSVDIYSKEDFSPGFVFGAATSAYQAEGAAAEDGRTPSVLDTFFHEVGFHGANGDVAVDEYHKYKEDVQLMVETGINAYRFSISWSRLIPNGRGPTNQKGIQYYNNVINELVRHGIQPHITLHHYDLPQALEDEYGGWVSRKIVKDFTAFADVCFCEFGDRVPYWTTFNEPNIYVNVSYDAGFIPANHCSSPFGMVNCTKGNSSSEPYLAAHHMLLAHASAASLYRKKYQGNQFGFIGISIFAAGFEPLTNSTEDAIATQRFTDFFHGIIAHPVTFGDYPEVIKKISGSRLPTFTKHESTLLKNSCDFLGLIHYITFSVKDNINGLKQENRDFYLDMAVELSLVEQFNSSTFEYPVTPWGLQGVLEYFKQSYGNPPIYILENGQRMLRNTLEDTSRVQFMHAYIGSMLDAIRNGSNTRGYFVWSLLDVLELLDGFDSGYGLYYVDLDDPELRRYPKLSARWYSDFLKGETTVRPDRTIKIGNEFISSSRRMLYVSE